MFVVPTQSYSGLAVSTDEGVAIVVLGPLPAGSVLRRVHCQFTVNVQTALNEVRGGLVLVGTDAPTVDNFDTGWSLIQRSPYQSRGKPAYRVPLATLSAANLRLEVGVQVSTGNRYFMGTVTGYAAPSVVYGFFTLEVQRLVEVQFTGPTF